jgi:hypothetical protein
MKMDDPVTLALVKAREIISSPNRWTQGFFAKDANGIAVMPLAVQATCFCALGALRKAIGYSNENVFMDATRRLEETLKKERTYAHSLATYNDDPSTTYEDIKSLFDDAIGEEV